MNLSKIGIAAMLIAAILILPVLTLPVSAAHNYYVSKYGPVAIDRGDGTGMLYVTVICHHTLISSKFIIQRVEQTGREKLVYGVPLTKENQRYLTFVGPNVTRNLRADGLWDERLVPGDYLLTLLDGNSGQPEYQLARIALGETSRVNFLGHAVSYGGGAPVCEQVKVTWEKIQHSHGCPIGRDYWFALTFDNQMCDKRDVTVTVVETYIGLSDRWIPSRCVGKPIYDDQPYKCIFSRHVWIPGHFEPEEKTQVTTETFTVSPGISNGNIYVSHHLTTTGYEITSETACKPGEIIPESIPTPS